MKERDQAWASIVPNPCLVRTHQLNEEVVNEMVDLILEARALEAEHLQIYCLISSEVWQSFKRRAADLRSQMGTGDKRK